jgi:hypothetical protein
MAILLSQHGNEHVGEKLVYRFVDQHPILKLGDDALLISGNSAGRLCLYRSSGS